MLQKRSRAVHVENLQPVTDSENRLAVFVGVLEQQYIDRIPRQVGVGRLGIACRTILLRQHIRPAARKQNRGTALDHLLKSGPATSSGIATASPPARSTARTYCGRARPA